MSTSSLDSASRSLAHTSRRITVFEQQYGPDALDLACHAAFPFTLTTDLVYCLRENFLPDCPWYAAADILLSGLCGAVGYDLYEMEGETRHHLLARLRDRFTEQRVLEVGDFMAAYIRHRLKVEESEQPRLLGDRPQWTALACLRPGEAFNEIQQALQRLGTDADLKERLRLSSLVEGHADLLPPEFRAFLIRWADQVAEEDTLDLEGIDVARARHAGFPLERREVTVAWIELSDDPLDALPFETQEFEIATVSLEYDEEIHRFEFDVATTERQGEEWVIERQRQENWRFVEVLAEGVELEMVYIPAGSFVMGSPKDEPERYEDEEPRHEVTVQEFYMGRYPITQAQWRAVAALPRVNRDLEADPSEFKGDDRPVEQVSWHDAVEFCDRLTKLVQREGLAYRLPSEAEWEYACRAGTATPFHFGEMMTPALAKYDTSVAYDDGPTTRESSRGTTPVGQFEHANAYGLADMHGNVGEWCLDYWHGNYDEAPADGSAWLESEIPAQPNVTAAESEADEQSERSRVIRGGSWIYVPRNCRSAYRYDYSPRLALYLIGFRVVSAAPRSP